MPLSEQELAVVRERRSAAMFFGFTLRAAKAQATKDSAAGLAGFVDRLGEMIAETDALQETAEQDLKSAQAKEPLPEGPVLLRAGAEW
jgi:hypothetical protein